MNRVIMWLAALFAACSCGAQVPQIINYQGRLLDGTNLVNGSVGVSLRLFNVSSGGSPICEDSNSVTVVDGLYATFIGDTTTSGSLGAALTNAQVWLEVAVNGVALTPRERMGSAAYAVRAGEAAVFAGAVLDSQLSANIARLNAATQTFTGAVILANASNSFGGSFTGLFVGNGAGLTNLDGGKLIGTVADARLSTNVALLNANQTFSGSNRIAGAVTMTNAANTIAGAFAGHGAGLTNLNAAKLTGTISSNNIAAGMISGTMLATGAVGSNQLAAGAVTTGSLADGAVTAAKVAVATNWFARTIANPTPAVDDQFGEPVVAVGTDRVLIGAFLDDTGVADAGAAYLFSTNGSLLMTFTNPTPAVNDWFGASLAAVGTNRVLIGARYDDTGAGDAGAAYLFSTSGALLTTLTNPTPAAAEYFGSAVAAVGLDRLLIGSPNDSAGASAYGAAYLFNTNGVLITTFTNPTPAANDWFGATVAAMGTDRVLIGAYYDDAGAVNAGAVYLFRTNGVLLTTFTNPAPAAGDWFGYSIAAVGTDRVLIGAFYDDSGAVDAGAAYLFNTNGVLLATFTNPAPAVLDQFGYSVAAVGSDRVLIGAFNDDLGAADTGAAYLFSTNGTLLAAFTNPTPATSDNFGSSVAAMGSDRVLIGAPGDDTGTPSSGAVYLFGTETFTPGLVADGVAAGSITTASLEDGAVNAAKIGGVLFTGQIPDLDASRISSGVFETNHIPNLDASKITSGTLSQARLPAAVVTNNAVNVSLAGVFAGSGVSLTNVNADQLDGQHGTFYLNAANLTGTMADARLSTNVALCNISQTFTGSNRFDGVVILPNAANALVGAFTGDGSGLTNVPGAMLWQTVAGTNQMTVPNQGYLLTNNALVTVTLPAAPTPGDVVRVSGTGAGGWRIAQGTGQVILAGSIPGNIGATWTNRASNLGWSSVASSADGTKLVAAVAGGVSGYIYTSTDAGVTWTTQIGSGTKSWVSIASSADGTKLAAAEIGGRISTSTNSGVLWTNRAVSTNWSAVASSADGTKLVAVVGGHMVVPGLIYTSTDSGINWTPRAVTNYWHGVASSADGTRLVAVVGVAIPGQIYTSSDSGGTWNPHAINQAWAAVASSADGSKLAAVVYGGQIYTSGDYGATWTGHGPIQNWWSVASSADGTKLVAVAQPGLIYTSTDSGVTWTSRTSSRNWAAVASSTDGTKLVAAVAGGYIYTSVPATTPGPAGYLTGGQYTAIELQYIGNGQFIPLSHDGTITAY